MKHEQRYRTTSALATLRAQGRNVTWLARQLGLSRQYTSDILHGHTLVKRDLAQRIAATLGVPLFLAFEVPESTENVPFGSSQSLAEEAA